ncbi:MAG: alpha-beta hydrolase superfamily lysophospholipase [Alphaproteobacteria bacterium]|jgi:alpha-beta hydrolase superfamily lysophospholipase
MFTKYIVLAVIFYISICAFMYFRQIRLIFPAHFAPASVEPDFIPFITSDGTKLESKTLLSDNATAPVIILFTGNAQNATSVIDVIFEGFEKNVNISTVNYRSFGYSEGTPSEEFLFSDALEFTKHAKKSFPNKKVHLMGISLGTGVASYTASKENVDGLILFTPYDSIESVAKSDYPWLPVSYLLKNKFNSVQHLQSVKAPIAIYRAGQDEVISKKHTDALANAAKNLAYYKTVEGMKHTQILDPSQNKKLKETLKEAMQSLEK